MLLAHRCDRELSDVSAFYIVELAAALKAQAQKEEKKRKEKTHLQVGEEISIFRHLHKLGLTARRRKV
jgi:hypothetical protein